jgi:hypothetical protein
VNRATGTRARRPCQYQFAYRLDAERDLTGKEFSALADRMVESTDPTQTAMLN